MRYEVCKNSPCFDIPRFDGLVAPEIGRIAITYKTKVSAAADRPARRRGSAYAKYSVLRHMVIKPFLFFGLAAAYRSRRWV